MFPRRARFLSGLALAAVAAANAAGLWSIAVSRRGTEEEAARLFRADVEARARSLENRLSWIRADLVFLAGSPPLTRLMVDGSSPASATFDRQGAESALLFFLRAHAEVTRLVVRGTGGEPLVSAGRRGGLPVLWVAANPTGGEGPAVAPDVARVAAIVPVGETSAGAEPPRSALEADLAPQLLFGGRDSSAGEPDQEPWKQCRLLDQTGRTLVRRRRQTAPANTEAHAALAVDEWTAPSPWRLECSQPQDAALALMAPVAARYRTTQALNVAAMSLAVLLGVLAVREVAQRERLEATGREESRVRDLERQLFHAERLTTVGRFAAGIAHEINNPLEGMANYLTLAREALERGDAETARRRLDGVSQGLERAALVLRQVLAHADPATAAKGPVDLNRVLGETAEFARSRAEFAKIRFETVLDAAPLMVVGSSIMLGQVALNLIVNACESQPAGGEVRVSAQAEQDGARVEVADRGPGIPAEDRARIFEPFFSTKSSTGLGLSICHTIAREHGGTLEAFPRDGGGTILRLTLPAGTARSEAA